MASAMIAEDGLEGDRARVGKRAVTLIQQEHLAAIGGFLGGRPVAAEVLRRNLVISGINLAALKGREVQVGAAVLRLTIICAPCSRMEEALGKGGYSAVRGHGGWCADVVRPGPVSLGDLVQPVD
ncbi:MOSC domain-containing protein [Ruegeria jejuensis]|uniref:MOSC domain-containing protein n=1 Tax=Ruegeria jejuensis TaxID=3233338 RepID=UPI00355AFC3A